MKIWMGMLVLFLGLIFGHSFFFIFVGCWKSELFSANSGFVKINVIVSRPLKICRVFLCVGISK